MFNHIFHEKKFFKLKGVVRRLYLNRFKQAYVRNQISIREGECYQCGQCCKLVFRCPFLNKAGRCLIYHKGRPMQCRTFPIDGRDLEEVDGKCGYLFMEEVKENYELLLLKNST